MKLLGIAGKKQAGKNTCVNFLFGLELVSGTWNYKGQVVSIDYFSISKHGKLVIPANVDGKIQHEVLELENPSVATQEFLSLNIWQYLKCYSFADNLKRKLCMDIFGLSYEQCYGTNVQKDTYTKYKWVDIPVHTLVGKDCYDDILHLVVYEIGMCGHDQDGWEVDPKKLDNEFMTARQFLQWMGTDVMREIYGQVWVDSCLTQIQQEQPDLGIIPDVRFPNEVRGIQEAGGKVIRFTRMKTEKDSHTSETALDDYEGFDYILDNMDMTIPQQNAAFAQILKDWNYFPFPLNTQEINIRTMYKEEVVA